MKRDSYDAIVVGSGAGGGMSAYVLAHAGLKVLMLEAGRDYDPVREAPMFKLPSEAPLRGDSTPDKKLGYYDATVDGGWQIANEPYTVAPGSEFNWWRARMLGGRTNHWGRVSPRFGPYDFKPYSRDGLGVDWPIAYDDLAPWYTKVEQFIGVTGAAHGLENFPDSPPGVHLPPPPPTASDYFVKRGLESMGIPVAAMRAAVLTRPLNGRPQCLYATHCMRGCAVRANFQSSTVLLPPSRETGNLEVRTNSLVYQANVNNDGRAGGVSYVDRKTGQHHSVLAQTVILAASACESARILLNSKSGLFPNGLANESGQVGRNLMDSVMGTAAAQFPALENMPSRNDDGISVGHMYVPWWGLAQQARKQLDFPRGYHIQLGGGRSMPGLFGMPDYDLYCNARYGAELREEVRRKYGSVYGFQGLGEMIPNDQTFCDIDPNMKDKWGNPVLRFHWKWSEHEVNQAKHMQKTFRGLTDRLGGRLIQVSHGKVIYPGGEAAHEVGTTRMGMSANDSVVNQFGQSWSVKNLFVMDGGVFASSPDKNPTLTILALSWRNSAYLVEQAKKGNL
jgi:choline dehydrogenase-like flavoprotein